MDSYLLAVGHLLHSACKDNAVKVISISDCLKWMVVK
jgi:hypothetical protein